MYTLSRVMPLIGVACSSIEGFHPDRREKLILADLVNVIKLAKKMFLQGNRIAHVCALRRDLLEVFQKKFSSNICAEFNEFLVVSHDVNDPIMKTILSELWGCDGNALTYLFSYPPHVLNQVANVLRDKRPSHPNGNYAYGDQLFYDLTNAFGVCIRRGLDGLWVDIASSIHGSFELDNLLYQWMNECSA